jgi:hypothetical protein
VEERVAVQCVQGHLDSLQVVTVGAVHLALAKLERKISNNPLQIIRTGCCRRWRCFGRRLKL